MTATAMETVWRVWALPAARSLVLGWTWLYTTALPEQVRTARRDEIRSDMHDQIAQDRREGTGEAGTAIDLLHRMASGAWDDLSWALPQIPSAMDGHLVRGSDAIGRMRPSPWVISYLGIAVLINVWLALSDWRHLWPAWPLANAGVLACTLLLQRQPQLWVRGILLFGVSFTILLALVMGISATWNSEPLPWPFHHSLMLEAVLMVPLIILGLLVATKICGAHVFDGSRWWTLLLCIAVIGFVLWGSGIAVDGTPENLLEVSVATAVLSIGWAVLAVGFAHGSKVGSYALLGGASITMRLLSKAVSQG